MSNAADLRGFFDAGRPLVEQWLAIAEQFAELRDEARKKEIDWAQVKALLKATIQDEADNGNRTKKIIDKAETASAYAGMLGLGSEKNISRDFVKSPRRSSSRAAERPTDPPHDPQTGELTEPTAGALPIAGVGEPAFSTVLPRLPEGAGSTNSDLSRSTTRAAASEMDGIPPFLDARRHAARAS